jgi:hypothetical protein
VNDCFQNINQSKFVLMKRILKISSLALGFVLVCSLPKKATAQDHYNRGEVTYQTFYDELSPYGQWIDYPGHGYVWVPDAGNDFRPYSSNGHWVWTDNYEWMWVSDYDWGWGPFHYGRWEEDPYYGWFWVPGYEWSPAWVAWRDGGEYYGWAPLRPGINISINFNIGSYSPPNSYWCFVPRRYITSPRIYDYYLDRRQNVTIINYTTIIINNNRYGNHYGYRSGPSRYEAERYCGRINPVRFRDSYSPGRSQFRNNEVSIYRPNVRHENNRNYAPRQFNRYDRNNDNRTSGNDNGFRRNNNDINGQGNRSNDNRINRPSERDRVNRNFNNENENNNRHFERRDDNRGNRQPDIRSNDQQHRPSRQFERRDDNNNGNRNRDVRQPDVRRNEQPQQQIERRQDQQSRQFERRQPDMKRNDQPQRQPQQMERRPVRTDHQGGTEQRQQQPSRQFERKNDDNRNKNSGNSNSRKRF